MGRFGMRMAALGLAGLMMAGCSSVWVTFNGPKGTVMTLDNKPYHLPAQVELWRPAWAGQSNRYPVSVVATAGGQEVRATGHIDVFGYNESDLDRMAVNTCNLEESELVKIPMGTVLIFRAQTASRQPLYDLTLGAK